jgi:motility quorum-sensing regulator/GCU-specific mRNA interferase toxin
VEKKRPTHDLDLFKACVSSVEKLNITVTAARSAAALGYTFQDIVDTIQIIERRHFYKSMTSHIDSRVW